MADELRGVMPDEFREKLLQTRYADPAPAAPANAPAEPMFVPAVTQLSRMQAEFESAAANLRQPKFFQSWFQDAKAEADVYAGYAKKAGVAADLLSKDDKAGATAEVDGLKAQFDTRAAASQKAARSFFADWSGRDKKDAEVFEGYSARLSKVKQQL